MKKALLIIRLPIETAFGLLYMSGLLLLPYLCRGIFPQAIIVVYLGMPRRPVDPAPWFYLNAVAALIGLCIVGFLFFNGLLWFKDVLQIVRKLRTKDGPPVPSPDHPVPAILR